MLYFSDKAPAAKSRQQQNERKTEPIVTPANPCKRIQNVNPIGKRLLEQFLTSQYPIS